MRPVHSANLERWLGAESVRRVSESMRGWYGPPIALAGVPGEVYACGDGDFAGKLRAGGVVSAVDLAFDWVKRFKRIGRPSVRRRFRERVSCSAYAGFASLSDLISEATNGGKRTDYLFYKTGLTGVANSMNTLWRAVGSPGAGGASSAAPGGRACDDTTTGGYPFKNPASGDTQHVVSGFMSASQVNNTVLLYDRLFDVVKTMSSTATEAVTGVPTRYQNTTAGQVDSVGGNFLFNEVTSALGATAHNWTVCQYTNQAGTTGQSVPPFGGVASAIADRFDASANGSWFMPLATGDTGIKALTQMQCSASVTGGVNFVIGRALAFFPCPIANVMCQMDFINTAFNLVRIFDDACLALLEVSKPSSTATNYSGQVTTVAG